MKLRTYVSWMRRESRGSRGRMLYFAACLAVGVAAVVGTAALAKGVEAGIRSRSREILGADLRISSHRPLPEKLATVMSGIPGIERTDVVESATMVSVPGLLGLLKTRLAVLDVVKGRYPLYGKLVTRPPGGLAAHLRPDTVVVDQELLKSLGLTCGDRLRVGGGTYRVAAAVVKEPGRMGFSSLLGGKVYLDEKGSTKTGLLGLGTRVRYQALFAFSGSPSAKALDRIVQKVKKEVPGAIWFDFDTHYEIGGRRSARRVRGFVGLVALLSLVVGGIGVAQIVKAWLMDRTSSIAVLRSIGLRPREIMVLSLGHVAFLALAGSVVGAAIGCTLPFVARTIAADILPVTVLTVFPGGAILRGLLLGVGLAVAFALPPLTSIWRVPPARVLRADADPLPGNRIASWSAAAALFAGVFGAAFVQGGSGMLAAWFTAGFGVLIGALYLGAKLLMLAAGRVPRDRLSPYLVHGISALARPGAGTTGAIVALGLGAMVVTGTWLVETRMKAGILAKIPAKAPNTFLLDIRPDQMPGVRKELEAAGAEEINAVPVIKARIAKIDGKTVKELVAEAKKGRHSRHSRHALTREQQLSIREKLPPDNTIVAGRLWSERNRPEVSVEQRFARRLGVHIGSKIEFDVEGLSKPVTLVVTSLRSVEWASLSLNFFLVVEPGAIPRKPEFYLANARLPSGKAQAFENRLAGSDSNVTVIRVGPILEKVFGLLRKIARGVGLLGSFTVLAGLAILAGAVSVTALRRGTEVALLKTLGVTRAGVALLLFTEYALAGAVAGAVGAGGAMLLAFGYLHYVAELPVGLPPLAVPIAAVACGILTGICGVAASVRSLTVRPIRALR